MGTQFAAKLTLSDRRQIREGIHSAFDLIGGQTVSRRTPVTKEQERQLGAAAIREVIGVAEKRDFFEDFAASSVFVLVLEWLRKLHRDAKFNGFSGIIKEYELENRANPIPALVTALRNLVADAEKGAHDRFRVATSSAARSVLAYAISQQVVVGADAANDLPAQTLGKQLAGMNGKELVTRYVGSFINEVVSAILSSSDPQNADEPTQVALKFSEVEATRIAQQVGRRIEGKAKQNEPHAIQQIVLEELQSAIPSATYGATA